jgi:hypothetical protein
VDSEQAHCQVWCRTCRQDFVVVGAARPHRQVTPAVEMVKCPYCEEPRKVMLARHMQGPVTGAYRKDEWEMSNR